MTEIFDGLMYLTGWPLALVLILGANRFERLGLNFINNNIVENITR